MLDKLKQLQLDLQENEERFHSFSSNFPGVMFKFILEKQKKTSFSYVSNGSLILLGLYPEALMEKPGLFLNMVMPQDKLPYSDSMINSANNLSPWNWEGRIQVNRSTEPKWISLRATPKKISDNVILWDGILIDTTRNKLAEIEIASSREQLAELSSYLQKIKEQERARIAREIDGDIGRYSTTLK